MMNKITPELIGKPLKAGLIEGIKNLNEVRGKITPEKAVYQLRTLIEDAESHREPDGTLDQIYQDDIAALRLAISLLISINLCTFAAHLT